MDPDQLVDHQGESIPASLLTVDQLQELARDTRAELAHPITREHARYLEGLAQDLESELADRLAHPDPQFGYIS